MKILVYALNYAPELVGVGKFTTECAEWLAQQGHAVTVITAPPHFPEWRIGSGYSGRRYRREQVAGVAIRRCPLWMPKRMSVAKRVACCVSFALSSLPPLLRELARRPDIVFTVEPTFFSVPIAWLSGALFRVPVWLHVQDFELGAVRGLGMVRSGWLLELGASLERWFLRRLHRVSTLSRRMDTQLAQMGVPAQRRLLFPNWVDCSQIRPLPGPSPYRSRLCIGEDELVLLYSGSFGAKHGLGLLVEVARLLRGERRLRMVLCGDGVEREALQRSAEGLDNILWLPLQPLPQLNDLLNLADIHLLPQRDGVDDAVLPSKLTGMFASGRPVVTTAAPGTELATIVAEGGLVVPAGDASALAAAVLQLANDPVRRRELGGKARACALRTFDRARILEEFGAALGAAVSG